MKMKNKETDPKEGSNMFFWKNYFYGCLKQIKNFQIVFSRKKDNKYKNECLNFLRPLLLLLTVCNVRNFLLSTFCFAVRSFFIAFWRKNICAKRFLSVSLWKGILKRFFGVFLRSLCYVSSNFSPKPPFDEVSVTSTSSHTREI